MPGPVSATSTTIESSLSVAVIRTVPPIPA